MIDNKKDKAHLEVKAEEKVEYKQLGATRRRKGLNLYALDNETGKIYVIEVEDKKEVDLTAAFTEDQGVKRTGKFKAHVNPDHKLMWALNKKNALRKYANDPDNLKVLALNQDDD